MGLFDIFRGKSAKDATGNPRAAKDATGSARAASERPKTADKEVARWSDAISKRAQNYDRQEAIDALTKVGTVDAAALLLKRFTFQVDPSITDQEEKESAFRGIVRVGEAALPAIRESFARAESVQFQLRAMREISNDGVFLDEVSALLAKWDTEYDRNPDPKVQMIAALESLRDPRVRTATERFLEDVNEPTRFQAVTTLLAQDDADLAAPLARALAREEAMRTKNRIAEGLAARGWSVPSEERDALARALPRGFSLDDQGVVRGR